VYQDPGPRETTSAAAIASRTAGFTGGSAGETRISLTRRRSDGDLTADGAGARGIVGVDALHPGDEVQGDVGHGEHPAAAAQERAELVQRPDGVTGMQLGEAGEHEVADGVAGEGARAAEPVLEQPGQLLGPVVVPGECGQRHPQVTGWQDGHLAADAP
jgi:hypothetical protein